MALRLPPVDVYRAPFIQPIGHLAMQAALAEDALIGMCAEIPASFAEEQMNYGAAAHELRNWGGPAESFIASRLALLADELRAQAEDAVSRYAKLRLQRHRAVHDAVTVGIFGSAEYYYVEPLAVAYIREGKSTVQSVTKVTPEAIAELACELYEVQQDLQLVTNIVRDRKPSYEY